tara:strand:+ start:801 stop:2240 length:1440 start_codon:yes stop_codon:yes gene_type:complete
MKINIILSRYNNIIGINNDLLCKIKEDMEYFKSITTNTDNKENVVIMGYNTWKSIPNKFRPLSNRINIVLSKNNKDNIKNDNVYVFSDLKELFQWLFYNKNLYNEIFVVGGERIYSEIFKNYSSFIKTIYLTEIYSDISYDKCDNLSFFNYDLSQYISTSRDLKTSIGKIYSPEKKNYIEKELQYKFNKYYKINNSDEYQYLNLLTEIIKENNIKQSRNSSVYSKFGVKMEFNLLNGFPLLTSKKMPWKTILRELLWFIKGETDNKKLNEKNVTIWNGNSTKEFLESRGLDYEIEGDLGPIYGFQWRHFGAEYINCDTDYNNKGVDQLKYIIDEIKNNPTSRRIILSAWNPVDIPKMALPPCHVMVQFNVEPPFIDAQLYQRSGDMFLGVPFNIASYSLLLSIIGKLCNYIPRKLIHVIGDAHIYDNHISAINTQINRKIHPFPKLEINNLEDIDNITEDMFDIIDYKHEKYIKAEMIP